MVSQNADVGGTRPGYSRRLGLRMRGPAGGGWRVARELTRAKKSAGGIIVGWLAPVAQRVSQRRPHNDNNWQRHQKLLIVLTHVLSPFLDLLRLLLIHPSDFVSGVTKCMQDFI
jgi:hypothetical protein